MIFINKMLFNKYKKRYIFVSFIIIKQQKYAFNPIYLLFIDYFLGNEE